jgi:hypothetical protein
MAKNIRELDRMVACTFYVKNEQLDMIKQASIAKGFESHQQYLKHEVVNIILKKAIKDIKSKG